MFSKINGITGTVAEDIRKLKHSSTVIEYHPEHMDTSAQWIYYPDPSLSYHRILVRHNFCAGSKGYWTETNSERFRKSEAEFYYNEYTYPLNTINKQAAIAEIITYFESKGITALGRWGEWQHYNSDAVVERAMRLCDRFHGKDFE